MRSGRILQKIDRFLSASAQMIKRIFKFQTQCPGHLLPLLRLREGKYQIACSRTLSEFRSDPFFLPRLVGGELTQCGCHAFAFNPLAGGQHKMFFGDLPISAMTRLYLQMCYHAAGNGHGNYRPQFPIAYL
jgi:hypothetical protein